MSIYNVFKFSHHVRCLTFGKLISELSMLLPDHFLYEGIVRTSRHVKKNFFGEE